MKNQATRLNFEERKIIEDEIKKGSSARYISRLLQRSKFCIDREIQINGGRKEYSFEKAELRSIEMKKRSPAKNWLSEKHTKLLFECIENGDSINEIRRKVGCCYNTVRHYMEKMGIQYHKKEPSNLFDRIDAIESQIEIILDIIEEMKK